MSGYRHQDHGEQPGYVRRRRHGTFPPPSWARQADAGLRAAAQWWYRPWRRASGGTGDAAERGAIRSSGGKASAVRGRLPARHDPWGTRKLESFNGEQVATKDADGKPVTFTRGQRVTLAMLLKNSERTDRLMAGGFVIKGRQGQANALRIDRAWAREFLGSLTPNESKIVDALMGEFNGERKDRATAPVHLPPNRDCLEAD